MPPTDQAKRMQHGNTLLGVVLGIVISTIAAFLVVWYLNRPSIPELGRAVDQTREKIKFDFPQMLEKGHSSDIRPEGTTQAASSSQIFLQVGSYSKKQDADSAKARLALMGIETQVQATAIEGKGMVHRVMAGPYPNREELSRVRSLLGQNKIDFVVTNVQ